MPRIVMTRFLVGPRQRSVVHAPVKALLLHVFANAEMALLASHAAVLPAAEWRRNRKLLVSVDPHGAGFQRASHAPGALVIVRPDAGREPEDAVVGFAHERRFIVERQADEDGGRIEKALFAVVARRTFSAAQQLAALFQSERHITLDRVAMLSGDE